MINVGKVLTEQYALNDVFKESVESSSQKPMTAMSTMAKNDDK